jgi:uncharacterized protein involved in response to NO
MVKARSAASPGVRRGALWTLGFRPLFLCAVLFAAVSIACWVAQFAGWTGTRMLLAGPLWHAHEMLFGYAFAVIAGFLFTAVRNWTNQPTPAGPVLAFIVALWLAARVLVLTPWPLLAAIPDTAFAMAVAAGIAVPLVRSRNARNYIFVGVVLAFGAVNLCFYLAFTDWITAGSMRLDAQRGVRFGLDLVLLVMVIVGGRVIPMFTANVVRGAMPQRYRWLEGLAVGSVVALLATDAVALPAGAMAGVAGVGAVAHGARLLLWQPWRTMRRPILWILHLSYAWIVVYLGLRAFSALEIVPASLAIHALTVGAIGGLTVGMMTRTARGHTGRVLDTGRLELACYGLVQLAAVLRVFVPLFLPQWMVQAIVASGASWVLAFSLLAMHFAPMLLARRVDAHDA